MAKIAVLTGNGLSVALSCELSLPNISNRFLNSLSPEQKALIEHHISDTSDKNDFERCIASVEKLYDVLCHYEDLLRVDEHGRKFGEANGLDLDELAKHVKSIRESIYQFSALIVETINGYVRHYLIDTKIPDFVKWLNSITVDQNEVDLFTLNFDLLLETILLRIIGPNKFMEFYHQGGPWFPISRDVHQYLFNPGTAIKKALKSKKDCKTKLYHLHGSLSSFKDLKNEKIFKVKTETIRKYDVYNRISELNIVPSIITGGRKSDKIQELPFYFYFGELMKKMGDEDHLCEELYIIGYSFRDDHINRAISERIKMATRSINPRPVEIVIVDKASTVEIKAEFIERINSALGLEEGATGRFIDNDERILFGGTNSIKRLSS